VSVTVVIQTKSGDPLMDLWVKRLHFFHPTQKCAKPFSDRIRNSEVIPHAAGGTWKAKD